MSKAINVQGQLGIQSPHAHPLTMARNPVILLRPEDRRARLNHNRPCTVTGICKYLVIALNGKYKVRQAIPRNNKV